jgi:hypothetical protein
LGYSAENVLFGGVFVPCPGHDGLVFSNRSKPGRRIYGLSLVPFPMNPRWASHTKTIDRSKHYPLNKTAQSIMYPVPTAFAALFQTEEFWSNSVGRYGRLALKAPRCFQTSITYLRYNVKRIYSMKPVKSAGNGNDNGVPGELNAIYQRVVDDFRLRQSIWRAARPWYIDSCTYWPPPFSLCIDNPFI